MDGRHYRNPPPLPSLSPKLRVIWNGNERRFDTEEQAEGFAAELRAKGESPCVCSF